MPDEERQPQVAWVSERHLRLSFDPGVIRPSTAQLERTLAALERGLVPGLISVTPAAYTILLEFDLDQLDAARVISDVQRVMRHSEDNPSKPSPAIIEIPVCYDTACAPDVDDVARMHEITHSELARLHAQASYVVQFIGFVPGFGYLSGLPDRLNTPRLDSPRVRVPAGSVGIAGNQTGVYPGNSAGGWRLIGRTPLRMFDADRAQPSLMALGNRVRFVPISLTEFNALARRVDR